MRRRWSLVRTQRVSDSLACFSKHLKFAGNQNGACLYFRVRFPTPKDIEISQMIAASFRATLRPTRTSVV